MSETTTTTGWTPESAAQYVAAESWPNEHWENRRAWAPRLVSEPEMAAQEVRHALERIERRRRWVMEAAEVLGVDVAALASATEEAGVDQTGHTGHTDPYCRTHCIPGVKHSQCGCDRNHKVAPADLSQPGSGQ